MSTTTSSPCAWLPWAGAALLGTFAGYSAWALVVSERAYCDAGYEAGDRFGLLYLHLPVYVFGYGTYAVVAYGIG